MNSENSRTSECHVLVFKLAGKLDLRRGQKSVALSNLRIYYTWKNIKRSYKNSKFKINAPIVELVLIHCSLVNNNYQQNSRILYTFVPNKPFGSLLEISPPNHIFLKTFNSEFKEIEVWFTNQIGQPLEVEDKINLTLIAK